MDRSGLQSQEIIRFDSAMDEQIKIETVAREHKRLNGGQLSPPSSPPGKTTRPLHSPVHSRSSREGAACRIAGHQGKIGQRAWIGKRREMRRRRSGRRRMA